MNFNFKKYGKIIALAALALIVAVLYFIFSGQTKPVTAQTGSSSAPAPRTQPPGIGSPTSGVNSSPPSTPQSTPPAPTGTQTAAEAANALALQEGVYSIPGVVQPSDLTAVPAPVNTSTTTGASQASMVQYNSNLGLYSYQFPDGHIVGSDTPPSTYLDDNKGSSMVGTPNIPTS